MDVKTDFYDSDDVMPPGTPYNAFILPYKIRVDDFADASNLDHTPALHLLTHTHTDHINGLSAKSFGSTIICSHDAKEMLLRHEVYAERALHEQELRSEKLLTFSHLKVDPFVMPDGGMNHTGTRDLLVCFPDLNLVSGLKHVYSDRFRWTRQL